MNKNSRRIMVMVVFTAWCFVGFVFESGLFGLAPNSGLNIEVKKVRLEEILQDASTPRMSFTFVEVSQEIISDFMKNSLNENFVLGLDEMDLKECLSKAGYRITYIDKGSARKVFRIENEEWENFALVIKVPRRDRLELGRLANENEKKALEVLKGKTSAVPKMYDVDNFEKEFLSVLVMEYIPGYELMRYRYSGRDESKKAFIEHGVDLQKRKHVFEDFYEAIGEILGVSMGFDDNVINVWDLNLKNFKFVEEKDRVVCVDLEMHEDNNGLIKFDEHFCVIIENMLEEVYAGDYGEIVTKLDLFKDFFMSFLNGVFEFNKDQFHNLLKSLDSKHIIDDIINRVNEEFEKSLLEGDSLEDQQGDKLLKEYGSWLSGNKQGLKEKIDSNIKAFIIEKFA